MRNESRNSRPKLSVVLVVIGLLAIACGGDQQGSTESASPNPNTEEVVSSSGAVSEPDESVSSSTAPPTSATPVPSTSLPEPIDEFDDFDDFADPETLERLWGVVFDRSPEGLATDAQIAQMQ